MAAPYSRPIVCPCLIGRAPHLALLTQILDQAQNGQGQIALVAGEAGIGKTRLVNEVEKSARHRGYSLLRGHCFETDRQLPYGPFIELLRAALAPQSLSTLAQSLIGHEGELIKLLPELARWLPGTTPTPPLDPEDEQRRIFRALAQCLANLTLHRPACLIIEDLHWSDDISLEFLSYLHRTLRAYPLALILTYRSDEMQPGLTRLLAELDRERGAVELRVAPLTVAEVDEMLRATFDLHRPIRPDFLEALSNLTDGNPFFIEEIAGSLAPAQDRGKATVAPDAVPFQLAAIPRTVQEAVQRRSRHLSSAAHQVLNLAAVAGRHFDFTLLQNALHFEEQELLRCIKELIAAQLVVEVSADEFAFRHALTRQAVYDGLLARERRTLHRIVGDTLEQQVPAAGDSLAADLSRHFYEAGVWAKARDYAMRAGERAQALHAAREAIELYTRAINAAERLILPPPPATYHARGRAHDTLGDFDGAVADYTMALRRARATGDRRAEWQALHALGFLWTARDYAQTGDYLRQALALARELNYPDLIATSLNRLGNWHMNIEQLTETLGYHEEALSIFREIGDSRGIAETLDLLAGATLTAGDLPRGSTYSEQAIQLLREVDNQQGLASCLAIRVHCGESYLTNTLRPTMRASEALGEGELALRTAREIGWRSGEAFARLAMGYSLGTSGDYARALQVVQEGLAIANEIEHRQWHTAAHCLLGALYLDLLASAAARQHLERALESAHEIGSLIWVRYATGPLAQVYIMEHDLARAAAVLAAALDPPAPMQTLGQRLCWCARAELALAQGAPELALHIVEQLAATAYQETGEYQIPRLGRLRGEALLTLRRLEEAETTLLAASETARTWGVRPMLWRIQIALGKLCRLNARHKDAEAAFADARAIIAQCAAPLADADLREGFLRRADALLPRHRPLSPRRAIKQASGGLTPRECEVAMLVARGLTNRQIATQLVISEETAAVHIKHILNKLGFASRAQIAAWFVQQPFFVGGPEISPA